MANVISTYGISDAWENEEYTARGVTVFQLVKTGGRWWILSTMWQRESDEARLGGKISRPLHAAEAHRSPPAARAADRVAESQAGELHRLVARPGGIQTDGASMPVQISCQNTGLAGTPAAEPAQFQQPAGRCSPLRMIGRHIVIKKAAGRRRGGRTEIGHRSL